MKPAEFLTRKASIPFYELAGITLGALLAGYFLGALSSGPTKSIVMVAFGIAVGYALAKPKPKKPEPTKEPQPDHDAKQGKGGA